MGDFSLQIPIHEGKLPVYKAGIVFSGEVAVQMGYHSMETMDRIDIF